MQIILITNQNFSSSSNVEFPWILYIYIHILYIYILYDPNKNDATYNIRGNILLLYLNTWNFST